MANYKMIGKNFAKELNNRLTVIHLSEMEKYNKPLIVSSQFGWQYGCSDTNYRIIYPPFKVSTIKCGNAYTLGEANIECSKVETPQEFFNNNGIIDWDGDTKYIKEKILESKDTIVWI